MAAREDIPWEALARYTGGACSPDEAEALSERVAREPSVAEALAQVLLHAVVVRDEAEANRGRDRSEEPKKVVRVLSPAPLVRALAGMLLAVAALVGFLALSTRDPHVLRVTALDGTARWTGRGGEVRESIKPGIPLPGGLLEALSDDSTVTLAFRDGTTITLLSRSAATISEDGQKRVHLRGGGLSADVKPQRPDRPLLIHTPAAMLEVLGTRFDVDSDAANTRLSVNEGLVRMTRLVDGRVAEVTARHEVVASLNRSEDFQVTPRGRPEIIWLRDFAEGSADVAGRWLAPEGTAPARIAAQPALVPESSRGPVTIHRVSVELPWRNLESVQVGPKSRLRIRGRTRTATPVEIMLVAKRPQGGHAGNFFLETKVREGRWQIDVPVGDFRKWSATSEDAPQEELQLRNLAIYTIHTDAGLELERIEVLRE